MAIKVDPIEFQEWKKGTRREDDDLLHAYRAIKTLSAIKFTITTEDDPVERLQKIERITEEWH